jgi:acyl-coenzyme A synthetase/AMP-(fatty) acid ligase
VPGRIEFVAALPRTALNKVARGRLRTRTGAGARW